MKKFHLSDIELFFTEQTNISDGKITLVDEELKHCCKVMRNKVGDVIHVTDGAGNIYQSEIETIEKNSLTVNILKTDSYKNNFENVYFCIPKLKNPDRLKFAFEKCVELGITNFIIFESKRTIGRIKNIERFDRILLSAMKQSLHAFLPKLETETLKSITNNPGKKFLFDQASKNRLEFKNNSAEKYYFLFGPEGGFESGETDMIDAANRFVLSNHRLRSETAVIKSASLITKNF